MKSRHQKPCYLWIAFFLFIIFFCSFFACKGEKKQQVLINAADVHELSYPTTQGLVKMDELLNLWTEGRIRINILPSGQTGGNEYSIIEQTMIGSLEMSRVSCSPLSDIVPEFKLYLLPYLFHDSDHMFRVLNGDVGRELLDKLAAHELVGLAYYDSGQRSFYTVKKPIRSIEDFKGLKIRVQQSELMADVVRTLGAQPVELAFEEVYSALYGEIIDGAENNFPSYVSKFHYKSAKYYTVDSHTRIPEIVLFSKRIWDTLTPEDQALIQKAAAQSVPYQRELWKKYAEVSKEQAINEGCTIIENVDKAAFSEAMQDIYKKYAPDLQHYITRIKQAR